MESSKPIKFSSLDCTFEVKRSLEKSGKKIILESLKPNEVFSRSKYFMDNNKAIWLYTKRYTKKERSIKYSFLQTLNPLNTQELYVGAPKGKKGIGDYSSPSLQKLP